MGPKLVVNIRCQMCEKRVDVEVPEIGFHAWQCGAMIQDAMPMLSIADRELLVSQTCGECWKKLFPRGGR